MRSPTRRRHARLGLVLTLSLASAAAAWLTTPRPSGPDSFPARQPPPGPRERDGLVLALVGDAAVSGALDVRAPGLRAVAEVLRDASITVANFELAATHDSAPGLVSGPPGWPTASPSAATDLRALGVSVVSLANDHVFDRGADGLSELQAQLASAGIAAAGAGENLEAARAPVVVATPDGPVALVGVTLTFHDGARATARHGDIVGRAGVNGLRYSRRLRVDRAAFAGLQAAFPATALVPNADGRTWRLHGITVEPAAVGGMALEPDADDLVALDAAVRAARAGAAAVIVSLHAHEPGPAIDEVPDLLRSIARAAIDAGADVVHGHGPHRLRGIEVHRGRPIFYSLGNAVFPGAAIAAPTASPFEDHRWDARSPVAPDGPAVVDFSAPVWWQSVAALVRVEGGRVTAVHLHALDLGVGHDPRARGRPAPADPVTAAAVYSRLQALSAPFGTTIAVAHGHASVAVP